MTEQIEKSVTTLAVSEQTPFGKQFRAKYFNIDPSYIPVNHGAYGCAPIPVLEAFKKVHDAEYNNSDKFFRITQRQKLDLATEAVAKVINADPRNLTFANNATAGVNVVLRSFPFQKGDKILIQSTVYGACGNTVKFLAKRVGIVPVVVNLDHPLTHDEVVELFEEKLKTNSDIKLCLFDAITSMPGIRLPFERLIKLCKKYNVVSLVDGAHSIGLIKIDLKELQPDFYISNLHKWLYTPRGCAFLYVDPKYHNSTHTFPISHSYLDDNEVLSEEKQSTRFVDVFAFTGTQSLANPSTVIDALKFRQEVCGGEDKIQEYCTQLALEAGKLVAKMWGTETLKVEDDIAMVNVRVPLDSYDISNFDFKNSKQVNEFRDFIELLALNEYNTYVQCCAHNGALWARFSAQVYNELDDYKQAAGLFPKIVKSYFESDQYKKYSHAHL